MRRPNIDPRKQYRRLPDGRTS